MNYTIEQQELVTFKKRRYVRDLTTKAIREGILKRPDNCQCCGIVGKVQAHHRDYGKPLEISWVCKKCHMICHHIDHPENPRNVMQTALPACVDQYDHVQVSISIPISVFLSLHAKSKDVGVKIQELIKKELFKQYNKEPNQLLMDFMQEDINDESQIIKIEGIHSVAQNEKQLPKFKNPFVPTMEKFHGIYQRNEKYAGRL